MSDEGGERVVGRRTDRERSTGIAPTGADETAEGSTVEMDSDIAIPVLPSFQKIVEAESETPDDE